jgi:hypothetical protein
MEHIKFETTQLLQHAVSKLRRPQYKLVYGLFTTTIMDLFPKNFQYNRRGTDWIISIPYNTDGGWRERDERIRYRSADGICLDVPPGTTDK